MDSTHVTAIIAALENQRNSALNTLVNTEAALAVAKANITELEDRLAKSAQVVEVPGAVA